MWGSPAQQSQSVRDFLHAYQSAPSDDWGENMEHLEAKTRSPCMFDKWCNSLTTARVTACILSLVLPPPSIHIQLLTTVISLLYTLTSTILHKWIYLIPCMRIYQELTKIPTICWQWPTTVLKNNSKRCYPTKRGEHSW
jgi:hypothetical protein